MEESLPELVVNNQHNDYDRKAVENQEFEKKTTHAHSQARRQLLGI